MTANPIDLVGGFTSDDDVPKADITGWAKARVSQVFGDPTEVRDTALAGQMVIYIKTLGVNYKLDPTDTTSADDPTLNTVIVSLDGKRFKPISTVAAPTTVSLGGVFASAAVTHQFLTGIGTDGNVLRAQPAASDLSDGLNGTGHVVRDNTPTLITPVLGVASATSINKVAITTPATGATLTVADGKTLTTSNTVTLSGTDGSTLAFGAGGTVAYLANKLSDFAATTSSQLASIISDETGSGALVFASGATLIAPILGAASATSVNKLAITAPASGATLAITDGKTFSVLKTLTLDGTDGTALTCPSSSQTLIGRTSTDTLTNKSIDASANTITNLTTAMFAANVVDTDPTLTANSDTRFASQKAIKSYFDNNLTGLSWKAAVACATTANITLSGEQTIDGVLTNASRALVKNQTTGSQNGIYITGAGAWTRATDMDAGSEFPSATVFVQGGTINSDTQWTCSNNSVTIGTTAVVFAQVSGAGTYSAGTGLTLTGNQFAIDSTVATLTGAQALTGKTYNGLTINTTTGTLALANGKTLTVSNTLTLVGTDGSTVTFGAGGTVAYAANNLSVFASTTSAQLAGVISDETGAGALVFAGSPALTGTPTAPTAAVDTNTTQLATAAFVLAQAASATPLMDNTAAVGTSTRYARADHVHPVDTSRAPASGIALSALAPQANNTIAGNVSGSSTSPVALTATQVTAMLNTMVGDSGAGGTKGLVPAPGSGDAAAVKFLRADATWAVPPGTGGGGSYPDVNRQNALLDGIYISKLFGGSRRVINEFHDGYKASDGVNSSASTNAAVNTTSGFVVASSSPAMIAGATGTAIGGMTAQGGVAAAFDGTNSKANVSCATSSAATSGYVLANSVGKDWGSGNSKTITRFDVYSPTDSGFIGGGGGAIGYKLQGSNDNSSWTDLASGSTPSGTNVNFSVTSGITTTTAYRYHRFVLNGNGTNNTFVSQIILYETPPGNMTLVTTAQTADATVSNGRVLIEYDNTATPTLNTDITAEVSCKTNTATVTISNASPAVVSHTAHGLSAGDPVVFTTTGALPTGITAGTTYFVLSPLTNSYNVSATPGSAAINTSSAGSGMHTATYDIWTAASLSAVSTGQAGRKVAESVDQSVTGGTSFKARIKTFNSKSVPIYGLSLVVH
jgi:hypothetical protein